MHLTTAQLEAGLDHILGSPKDAGLVELIVQRPEVGARLEVDTAQLDAEAGLVGDNWRVRGSALTDDGAADPLRQLTLMNSRAADLVAGTRERWALAGDQIYVDLDLGHENLPAGSRLAIGGAVVEISEPPHTGCAKFSERFGADALRFVNVGQGKDLRLRGVNAWVVEAGAFSVGDRASKL